jgi:hypothetical protein
MQEGMKREEWNNGMMEDEEPQRNRAMMEAGNELNVLFFEEPNIPVFHHSVVPRFFWGGKE